MVYFIVSRTCMVMYLQHKSILASVSPEMQDICLIMFDINCIFVLD